MINTFWSIIPNLQIIEIACHAGYDSIIFDREHGTFSFTELNQAVALTQSLGLRALVRPCDKSQSEILSCLETGVDGLMIPHVTSKEEVEDLMSSAFYPPLGSRGASGFTRATEYGNKDFASHMVDSNEKLFFGILIESAKGIKALDDILKEGHRVDCVYYGTYDIAISVGENSQRSEIVREMVNRSIESIKEKVEYLGQVSTSKYQRQELNSNINFIAHGVDCGIILNGFKNNLQ